MRVFFRILLFLRSPHSFLYNRKYSAIYFLSLLYPNLYMYESITSIRFDLCEYLNNCQKKYTRNRKKTTRTYTSNAYTNT